MMTWASAATSEAELTAELTALRDLTGDRVARSAAGAYASGSSTETVHGGRTASVIGGVSSGLSAAGFVGGYSWLIIALSTEVIP